MPMWVPGSRRGSPVTRGFTLLELMLVVAIVAMASAGVGFALRGQERAELAREAQRLVALLESARAQSRASGLPVRWHADATGFVFEGLPVTPVDGAQGAAPADKVLAPAKVTHWLVPGVLVSGTMPVTLGPEPIIERQDIVLTLAPYQLQIATDGLRPFAVRTDADAAQDAPP